jgi:hypothetical protein
MHMIASSIDRMQNPATNLTVFAAGVLNGGARRDIQQDRFAFHLISLHQRSSNG